jgi:hypothetical protein
MLQGERYVSGVWVTVSLRVEWVLVWGEQTTVPVGMECYRKVKRMDKHGGYQPPKGGPKLGLIGSRG